MGREAGAAARVAAPTTPDDAAAALREGGRIRIAGSGTRPWGALGAEPDTVVSTRGLERILAHDPGDFTAVLEAGVPLASAQAAFAQHGQRLCLDPPGDGTIGGMLATADSGPLRHRYGTPRDLVIGATLALADGTVAKAGGTVIKNVAGYDLAKLVCGSYGTLALICRVAVRLHALPPEFATAVFERDDPGELDALASDLAHRPLEADALDVRWQRDKGGAVLARFAGATCGSRARALNADRVEEDDEALWHEQRERQRGPLVLKVSAPPRALAQILAAAPEAVGRAGAGVVYVRAPVDADVDALRDALPGRAVLLDAPASVRAAVDVWDADEDPALDLQRRVKARFDPEHRLNRGIFVGGI